MNLEELLENLLREGKIKKQTTDVSFLNASLDAAKHNLKAAEYNLNGGYWDTAFKSAYDGLLQISRVILLLSGYRPDDGEQHKTTFRVAGALLGNDFSELIDKIDRYRIKRNNVIYKPLAPISKREAEGIFKSAHDYWAKVKIYLKDKNKQLELFEF